MQKDSFKSSIPTVKKMNKRLSRGAENNRPETLLTILKEWDALYTTQMTQKSKKYHDGIIRLANCGSHMHQVFLLNEEGALLSSKYVKSVETVQTDHKFEFSNYLVEIGDPRVLPEDGQTENSIRVADCNRSDDARSTDRNNKEIHDEWNILYTTQITQKSKKYHDGLLRLTNCGLHTRQVTLLNEDGTELSSKYLKSVEHVESGGTCAFPNYLVEICERRNPTADGTTEGPLKQVLGSRSVTNIKLANSRRGSADKSLSNADKSLPKDLHKIRTVPDGCIGKSSGQSGSLNRPIRDAFQILSTLRRPSPACEAPPVKTTLSSHSSDLIILDIEENDKVAELNVAVTTSSRQIMNGKHEGNSERLDSGGAYLITTSKNSCLRKEAACETASCSAATVANNDQRTSTLSKYSSPSEMSRGPLDKTIEIAAEGKSPQSSEEEQTYADSISSLKDNINPDENTTLSDQIMNLQHEWTTMAHNVSTSAMRTSSVSSPKNNV